MKTETAIIGGSGLDKCPDFELVRREVVTTPYGDPSGTIAFGLLAGHEVVFLPRHGVGHTIPPHRVNYRANIWALKDIGIRQIFSVNAVGAIESNLANADIVIPDQIIDYTWGREHSFFDGFTDQVQHIEFTEPYSQALRLKLIESSEQLDFKVHMSGVYAATQGPRLETAAEVKRLARDGATIVGMTGMPEVALARELDINYAAVTMIVNMAAGLSDELISMEMIRGNLEVTIARVIELIGKSL